MDALTVSLSLSAAAAGVVSAGPLVRFARRRAVAQPVDVDLDAEQAVLAAATSDVSRLADGEELTPDDFADPDHAAVWAALQAAWRTTPDGEDPGMGLVARARAVLAGDPAAAVLDAAVAVAGPDTAGYIAAGETVMALAEDRTRYAGRCTTVSRDGSWVRQIPPPAGWLTRLVAVVLALAGAAVPWLAASATSGAAATILASGAGLVLVALGMHVALVDIDTLRIDVEVFWPAAGLAWALAAGATVVDGRAGDLVGALAATAVIVGLFELLAALHRRLRGVEGQGFGDTLLALATVGVPVALAGNWLLAYYTLMAAVLGALATFLVRRASGTPSEQAKLNPFGPFLAAGWLIGWVVLAAGAVPSSVL